MRITALILTTLTLLTAAAAPAVAIEPIVGINENNFPFPFPGGPNGPGRPGFPPRPDRPGRGELVFQRLNESFQGQNTLALRKILNLGPEYRGRMIRSVILRASTAAGRGQAWVTVNGSAVTAAQRVGTRTMEYRFDLPREADELGDEIQQLQFELQGNFFVDGVGVLLENDRGPGRPGRPIEEVIQLNQQFQGGHRIAIGTLINLQRYQGMQLRSVSFRASTRAGQGDATFCASTCTVVQNVGRNLAEYQFPIAGEYVDHNAQNWALDLRGNFFVESIRLEFTR